MRPCRRAFPDSGIFHVPHAPDDYRRLRHIEYDLRMTFLRNIQKLPLSYFQNTSTGISWRMQEYISAVRNALGRHYVSDGYIDDHSRMALR